MQNFNPIRKPMTAFCFTKREIVGFFKLTFNFFFLTNSHQMHCFSLSSLNKITMENSTDGVKVSVISGPEYVSEYSIQLISCYHHLKTWLILINQVVAFFISDNRSGTISAVCKYHGRIGECCNATATIGRFSQ